MMILLKGFMCLGLLPFSQTPVKILCGFRLDQVLKELKIPAVGAHEQCQVSPRDPSLLSEIWQIAKILMSVNSNHTPRR